MSNLPKDCGELDPKAWQSDDEPEPARLPEWTAHGARVKYRHPRLFAERDLDEDEEVARLSWNVTPKDSSRLRSGGSRRNLFAASPNRNYAQSTIMEGTLNSISGSRKLRR